MVMPFENVRGAEFVSDSTCKVPGAEFVSDSTWKVPGAECVR
jgi:hypothetical protein